jgi:hypothetical protein
LYAITVYENYYQKNSDHCDDRHRGHIYYDRNYILRELFKVLKIRGDCQKQIKASVSSFFYYILNMKTIFLSVCLCMITVVSFAQKENPIFYARGQAYNFNNNTQDIVGDSVISDNQLAYLIKYLNRLQSDSNFVTSKVTIVTTPGANGEVIGQLYLFLNNNGYYATPDGYAQFPQKIIGVFIDLDRYTSEFVLYVGSIPR